MKEYIFCHSDFTGIEIKIKSHSLDEATKILMMELKNPYDYILTTQP